MLISAVITKTLSSLLKTAVSFKLHPRHWVAAGTVVTELHHFSTVKSTIGMGLLKLIWRNPNMFASGYENEVQENLVITGADKYRRLKGRDSRLDRIDDIKRKMDLQMDSKQLANKLHQTQVPPRSSRRPPPPL